MKRIFLLFLFFPFLALGQVFIDDFEDANLDGWFESNSGHWQASDISPIDGNYSLHHIFDSDVSASDQISHPISANLSDGTTVWKFQVRYEYNPSSTNNWTFFLMADTNATEMKPSGEVNGYAIGVNFTGYDDTLYLYKISNGAATKLINTGINWQQDIGYSNVGIMVSRSADGLWKVFVDFDGGFDNLIQVGSSVVDQTFLNVRHLGVFYEYTSSYDQKLWIDDVQFYPPSGNDNDSQVLEGDDQEPFQISSIINSPDGVEVFDFILQDLGTSDGKPTYIQAITISQGDNNNISNWADVIAGAKLFGDDLTNGFLGTVENDKIVFSADTLIKIQDNSSEHYYLKIWLKEDLSSINDNDNFEFKIDYQDILTYYEGSSFGSGVVESGDNNNHISISATELRFENIPISVLPNTDFSLTVKATDKNGNLDLDANNLVSLFLSYGDGQLSSESGLSQNLVNGSFTWNDLQYSTLGNFKIQAQAVGIDTIETPFIVSSQYLFFLNDDFEDGDITDWIESESAHWQASDFEPINGYYSLRQVYDADDYGTDIICHQLPIFDWNLDTLVWKFQIRYENSSPSSSNNWQVFLVADNDYSQMNQDGSIKAFVLGVNFNSSDDLLKLWYIDNGNISEVISTSFDWNNTDASLPKSFVVIRTNDGQWELKIDDDGGFDDLITIGTGTNSSTFSTNYFGIVYNYSSTQDRKLTVDDIYIGEPIPDLEPPLVDTIIVLTSNTLKVIFNEDISPTTAENTDNYFVNNGIGNPITVEQNSLNKRIVNLIFVSHFLEDTVYQLQISNIADVSGNVMNDTILNFNFENIHFVGLNIISQTELELKFNKILDTTSALNPDNYLINNGIGNPISIQIENDSQSVFLTFANQMQYEQSYVLHLENIKDKYGNQIEPLDYPFVFYVVRKYDIVVNELMIDVNPQPVALPPYKYIELYNKTDFQINLKDWILKIGDNKDLVFPDVSIQPNGYLIICSEEAQPYFEPFGTTVPILVESYLTATSGKRIILKNSKGQVIEDITYSPDWYYDEDKDDGGWSLERIDPFNICNQDDNWHASENYAGGTPAFINSVYANNPDILPPKILGFKVLTSQDISITFSEVVDSSAALSILNYILNNDHTPIEVYFDNENPKKVYLHFLVAHNFGENNLVVKNISDYCQNVMNDTILTFYYQPLHAIDVEPKSEKQLKIYFSEPVSKSTAENPLNYSVNYGVGNPSVVLRDANDSSIVHLFFENEFPLDTTCTIQITGLTDIYGNPMSTNYLDFTYHIPQMFDIVINELMLDVNPQPAGLPPYQYIELFNTRSFDIWLTDWTFLAENQRERKFPTVKIPAYGFLLISTEDGQKYLSDFGTTVGILGTNDLTQEGKLLQIFDNRGNLIYFLRYSKLWYQDDIKEDGGWSLEKINPFNFCDNIRNWKASDDISGGTPYRNNSVYQLIYDSVGLKLLDFKIISSNHLLLTFNKNLNFASAENVNNYNVSSVGSPYFVKISDTSFKSVELFFSTEFQDKGQYQFTISNLQDNCSNTLTDTTLTFVYYRIYPQYVWVLSENQLKVKFSETVDYSSGTNKDNFYVDNQIGYPNYIVRSTDDPSVVFLQFDNNFVDGQTYTLSIENVKDVNGNVMHPAQLSFIYYIAKPKDVVINEILFNPYPHCVDYVELYNRSIYPINLKNLRIAKRDDSGLLTSVYKIVDYDWFLQPDSFVVLTTDTANVKQMYPYHGKSFIQLDNIPSYPDDEGIVVILNDKDSIIDEFHYSEDMHYALISNPEGVALERVNPNLPTNDTSNWHSAAQSVGFGTPALKNSQFVEFYDTLSGQIVVEPEVFSPDNDGVDDILFIRYTFDKAGYFATVLIFDKNGILIKHLANDELISQSGYWTWDGITDKNTKAKLGVYLLIVKIFDLEGNVKIFRKPIIIAGK